MLLLVDQPPATTRSVLFRRHTLACRFIYNPLDFWPTGAATHTSIGLFTNCLQRCTYHVIGRTLYGVKTNAIACANNWPHIKPSFEWPASQDLFCENLSVQLLVQPSSADCWRMARRIKCKLQVAFFLHYAAIR